MKSSINAPSSYQRKVHSELGEWLPVPSSSESKIQDFRGSVKIDASKIPPEDRLKISKCLFLARLNMTVIPDPYFPAPNVAAVK